MAKLSLYILALTFFAWQSGEIQAETATAPEYNVKAGFLMAFVRYTTWPAHVTVPTSSPIKIAILGDDPFKEVLDKTAAMQKASGTEMQVVRITKVEEASECHLVFIGKTEARREGEWLQQLKGKPVLTVCESEDSVGKDSVVRFVVESNRVRFDVDWQCMEQAGLKISSKMLASARKIHNKPGGKAE